MKLLKKSWRIVLGAHTIAFGAFAAIFVFVLLATGFVVANGQTLDPSDSHVVSLYLDGQETIMPTRATTVQDFLTRLGVTLYEADLVEPGLDTPITEDDFNIQIYRARPITIIDGTTVRRVLSPHTGAHVIAEKAGFTVYPEDILTVTTATNFVQDMILGEKLIIDRATPVSLSLYGAPAAVYRTQSETVGEFLKQRGIVPEIEAVVTPTEFTPISVNLPIFISKFGKQVISVEEPISFAFESTDDPNMLSGQVTIIKPGVTGKKQMVYELELRDGIEIGRRILQEVVIVEPQPQLQTRGTKPGNGLNKTKGVNIFTDSRGVTHRETYYDLPMSNVMRNCDAEGVYMVRDDGAKVDRDGYIIVAANLNIYSRCSIIETSIGLGKVYDTGTFALTHPYGFDLATDWSKEDGI